MSYRVENGVVYIEDSSEEEEEGEQRPPTTTSLAAATAVKADDDEISYDQIPSKRPRVSLLQPTARSGRLGGLSSGASSRLGGLAGARLPRTGQHGALPTL